MNAPPGDPESDSLKWLTFCDRVNNHGEDPYDTMREMGLDQHFFENVPMAEPVSSSEDVVGLPFVETVDERGESPVAEEIFTAPPTITDSPVQGMNIPDELRDEIILNRNLSNSVIGIETSPTAQLFNQRIVNTPDEEIMMKQPFTILLVYGFPEVLMSLEQEMREEWIWK